MTVCLWGRFLQRLRLVSSRSQLVRPTRQPCQSALLGGVSVLDSLSPSVTRYAPAERPLVVIGRQWRRLALTDIPGALRVPVRAIERAATLRREE